MLATMYRSATGTPRQAGVDVVVHVAAHEVGVDPAPGEIGEVEEQEQRDDDARPAHRAAGEVGGLVVAGALVLHRAGLAVEHGQAVGGVDVQDDCADQPDAA